MTTLTIDPVRKILKVFERYTQDFQNAARSYARTSI
jgi:hypothetical protein